MTSFESTNASGGAMLPPPPAPIAPAPNMSGGPFVHLATGWSVAGAPVSSAGKRFGAYLLEGVLALCTLFIGWLIWSLIIWSKGQTPAKALLHMRVVRTDTGRAAGWGQMFLREAVGKLILGGLTGGITTLISCFMVLGATRQGIWDKMATTVVIDDPNGAFAPR